VRLWLVLGIFCVCAGLVNFGNFVCVRVWLVLGILCV
jgi:hypothetical protein